MRIAVTCPKCHTKLSFSDEQLQGIDAYNCPSCGWPIDIEPLKKQVDEKREESLSRFSTMGVDLELAHKETCEITAVCPKCQTRIPISIEQLQSQETYSCPQCGAAGTMAPLREAFQEAQERSKSGGTNPEPYHIVKKTTVSAGPGKIIWIAGIIILVVIIILALYRMFSLG
jgi:peptide subunit release factor 1 (eRF1)